MIIWEHECVAVDVSESDLSVLWYHGGRGKARAVEMTYLIFSPSSRVNQRRDLCYELADDLFPTFFAGVPLEDRLPPLKPF